MSLKQALLALVLAVAAFFLLRQFVPPRVIRTPPEIITRWDTVEVLDTAWVTEIRRQVDTINLVREVLIERTDTVLLTRTDTLWHVRFIGMDALMVPLEWGDTMRVRGFEVWSQQDSLRQRTWQANYFTAGPLKSLLADSIPPRVQFHPMPPPPCGTWCKAKLTLLGGAVGAGSAALLCTLK